MRSFAAYFYHDDATVRRHDVSYRYNTTRCVVSIEREARKNVVSSCRRGKKRFGEAESN